MKWVAHIKEGLLNLYFSKMRSALALLGVLVGTASVVAMVLGGEIATEEALRQFKSLGTDLLALTINTSADEEKTQLNVGKLESLTLSQALALPDADQRILKVAPYVQVFQPVYANGHLLHASILGVTDHFADIAQVKLKQGRFISLLDKYAFYCVIGHHLYEELKSKTLQEPLGQHLQIAGNIYVIIGVAEPWLENSFVYANIDNAIMVPILSSLLLSKYATIDNFILRLMPDANIAEVQEHVAHYIQKIIGNKQIFFRSAKELIAKMQKQTTIMTIFLGLIGSISLIVGGIGVMNIMLVSVIERKREIGIRLAVGARRMDIVALFLFEAIVLALLGGAAGVIIGILIAYLIAWFSGWQFILFLLPPLVGFAVSALVGIFFGFYPAYLASKLNPIEALRSE